MADASKQTGYHQDYLGFLARQGKLKASKMGRNWFVSKGDLAEFIKNYKNGISEVIDEAGQKIKVHIVPEEAHVILQPQAIDNALTEQAMSKTFISEVIPQAVKNVHHTNISSSVESMPIQAVEQSPAQILGLHGLRKEVLEALDSRILNLSQNLSKTELKIHDQKQLQQQFQAVEPVLSQTRSSQSSFVSNFDFGAQVQDSESSITTPQKYSTYSLGADKIKNLYQSFSRKQKSNLPFLLATSLMVFLGVVGSYLFSGSATDKGVVDTKIVYSRVSENAHLTSVSKAAPASGNVYIVNKNVGTQVYNKLLGLSDSAVYLLIDQRLNQYLADGKLKGEKGDTGIQGLTGTSLLAGGNNPFTTYAPNPGSGFTGATSLGVTQLSAGSADIAILKVGQLSVSGSSIFGGPVTFNSSAIFNGSTTISSLVVNNINPGFIQGSVVFQGANGLAQDNSSLFYNASTSQLSLGTTTPNLSALLELDSTSKGFLAPRMTIAQRDAIVSPAEGLLIFNTNAKQYNIWDGVSWGLVGGGGGGGAVATGTPGSFAYYQSSTPTVTPQSVLFISGDNIGVGTSVPSSRLTIVGTSSPNNIFTIASTSGSTLLTVSSLGNLGIGTSTPGSALTVVGSALLTGNQILLGQLSVNGTSTLATSTISNLTVSGNSSIIGNQVITGNLNISGNSTLATTSISSLSLYQALGTSSGGTGTSTLGVAGSLAYSTGSSYGFSAAGSNSQILISSGTGAPIFTNLSSLISQGANISITGTSTLVISATSTPSFTTVNGLVLTPNADGFSVAGGTTSRTLTVTGGNVALNNITVNGGGNILTLFGSASLNQNLTTTSTPSFAGLTINGSATISGVSNFATSTISALTVSGNATTTGNQIISGNLNVNSQTSLGNASTSVLSVSGNLYSGNHIITGALNVSATSTLASSTIPSLASPDFLPASLTLEAQG